MSWGTKLWSLSIGVVLRTLLAATRYHFVCYLIQGLTRVSIVPSCEGHTKNQRHPPKYTASHVQGKLDHHSLFAQHTILISQPNWKQWQPQLSRACTRDKNMLTLIHLPKYILLCSTQHTYRRWRLTFRKVLSQCRRGYELKWKLGEVIYLQSST